MDTSPTALFDSYEQDFKQLIEAVVDKLDNNAGAADLGAHPPCSVLRIAHSLISLIEQRRSNLRRVEMELDEADEMVRLHYPRPEAAHRAD